MPAATRSAAPARNSKFYIDDRTPFITLKVEGQLFRVHRYLFESESEVFKSMFEIPREKNNVEGETDESPIVLPSVTVAEMEALLSFFYPKQSSEERFTGADWCNLLSISHRYEFQRACERSISEISKLDLPLDNVDKILMAEKYMIQEWFLPAWEGLVTREDPFTYSEAEKLGLTRIVLLGEAREKHARKRSLWRDTHYEIGPSPDQYRRLFFPQSLPPAPPPRDDSYPQPEAAPRESVLLGGGLYPNPSWYPDPYQHPPSNSPLNGRQPRKSTTKKGPAQLMKEILHVEQFTTWVRRLV